MNTHFEILIDASGSMGNMQGQGAEHENKYLLPDGSTRTDLVKKILINSILPKLSLIENITISTFRNEFDLDKYGNRIIVKNVYKSHPELVPIYSGKYNSELAALKISKIENPEPGGTPLFWAIAVAINQSKSEKQNIIVLSDGGANDRVEFDSDILKIVEEKNKQCKIYFIGIDQNSEAETKSKNLAQQTNGFYTNIKVSNYDQNIFNSSLFELNTTITKNLLNENIKIEDSTLKEKPIAELNRNSDIETIPISQDKLTNIHSIENITEKKDIDLKSQIEDHTKSIKLITSQLSSIVDEIKFIRKNSSEEYLDEFNSIDDEVLNRAIGYKCEHYLNNNYLKEVWDNVYWLNEFNEQNKPYDFEVIDNGIKLFIECKGSINKKDEFFLTKNEWQYYLKNRSNYRLFFVQNINSGKPVIIEINDLLSMMENGKLLPCSSINRKLKADRIIFQIISS